MPKIYSIDEIINTLKQTRPDTDFDLIRLAYDFANQAHEGQMRESGEPYINHPLATAQKLADLGLDTNIIVAGILHDVPEDTEKTLEDVEKNFGKDVATMVEGITKLSKIKYRGVERYMENLRKMFVAMAKDVRVIIIKFADRIHNLQTLYAKPPVKQKRIAQEALEIYAPIARRLSIGALVNELEDNAFKYALPSEYNWTQNLVKDKTSKKEKTIEKAKKIIIRELKKHNVNYLDIHGRSKHLYSLYLKLLRFDRDIEKIHDLMALRIIVNDISDCYAALGTIHQLWKPLPGKIKDYIAQPKPNGYQSLHTTVFCVNGDITEFQIRTKEMHQEAEFGIASHWHYKEKGKLPKIKWIKELAAWQKELEANQNYLDNLKLDVFQNRLFIFTPRGDVIDLPEGSTPVDFAYHIHTEIGDRCSAAKINDKIAPLDTVLKNGDVVEILVDKNRKGPNEEWLKFVKTRTAKTNIRAKQDKWKNLLSRFYK